MTDEEFQAQYQAAIPACCELKTIAEHAEELMLCWGLAHQVRTASEPMKCGMCEYNTDPEAEVLRQQYAEDQRKKRMWGILNKP